MSEMVLYSCIEINSRMEAVKRYASRNRIPMDKSEDYIRNFLEYIGAETNMCLIVPRKN